MLMLPTRYVTLEEEFKRNPDLKMSDLQMLKDWLRKQPHLPQMDIHYLVYFLHSNYYRLEPTKRTLENFYTVRTHFPEVFSNRDPIGWKELRKAFTVVTVAPLEQKTKEDYIMVFAKLLDLDPNQMNIYECIKYAFMTCEIHNIVNGTNEGQVIIFDLLGFSLRHVALLNVMFLKKICYYLDETVPVRLKAIHVLNAPVSMIQIILNLLKPFTKAEKLQIFHFHSSLEAIKEFVPLEALPNEYGGQAGPIEEIVAKNIKFLEDNREWFQYDERIGRVDESLRVGKLSNGDLFGMDGSFKKLEID